MVPPPRLMVGDIVLGRATKNRSSYHQQKGKITVVLAKHYRVLLLEGDAVGNEKKYLHATVSLHPSAGPRAPSIDAGAASETPTDANPPSAPLDCSATVLQSVEDLFSVE